MPEHVFVDIKPLSLKQSSAITASKYGMMEIFRHSFSRAEAVLTMRGLSRKFFKLSFDPYLVNFKQDLGSGVYCEVREDKDRHLLKRIQRYATIINANEVLHCEIYYKFPDMQKPDST